MDLIIHGAIVLYPERFKALFNGFENRHWETVLFGSNTTVDIRHKERCLGRKKCKKASGSMTTKKKMRTSIMDRKVKYLL